MTPRPTPGADEPYATGRLDVADGQSLYWEWCGNPHGRPVRYLHGGRPADPPAQVRKNGRARGPGRPPRWCP